MNQETDHQDIKRSQKTYGLSFKLEVVQEVEIGIKAATRKYGITL